MSTIGAVLKSARPRVVAALRRFCGDLSLAEDAFQDAAERALTHWSDSGVPDNPTGWLVVTGRRLVIDQQRRAKFSQPLETEPDTGHDAPEPSSLDDDLLRLIFACCHPALDETAQVALTLRVIVGLPTADIATAFLVKPRTMEQRLDRARRKIRDAGIPFDIPEDAQLPARMDAVRSTVYLIFNQGYSARADHYIEPRLCAEAIWLGRLLLQLAPGDAETTALLALMLLHHARHPARCDDSGTLIPLPEQDRSRWLRPMIDEGQALLEHVIGKHKPGPYQTQAAIASLHSLAGTAIDTDWTQIAALYEILESQLDNPVVRINRAVALGESGQAAAGLALLKTLSEASEIQRYVPYYVALQALHQLIGNENHAQIALQQALALSTSPEETAFLQSKYAHEYSYMGHKLQDV
ncbi:MAG: sigma-70 family RNA polymerase sigma factor [Pseudomonadota bacterium]